MLGKPYFDLARAIYRAHHFEDVVDLLAAKLPGLVGADEAVVFGVSPVMGICSVSNHGPVARRLRERLATMNALAAGHPISSRVNFNDPGDLGFAMSDHISVEEYRNSAFVREVFGEMDGHGFDVAPSVPVVLLDDVEAARDALKPYYALYIGGMGSRGKNFYNELFARYGYEAEAAAIQDAYLDGRQRDAAALVPDAFVDEAALVGPKERIAERLEAYRGSGATTLLLSTRQPEALRAVAELAL